jgi:putative membrane protein
MAKRKESVMKPLTSLGIAPIAAALCVLLAAAGCKKHENATDENAAGTPPPAAATAAAPMPASTTAANSTMGSGMNDTTPGNANEASTAGTTGSSATDMSGASTAGSNMGANANGSAAMDAMASGPVTDTQFYTQAMMGDQKEIDASQMVEKQGSSADVKKVAKKIESDHTAFDKKVKAAAGSTVTPPAPGSATASSLQGKTGADLDRAYVDEMVTDHQKVIAMFENVTKNGSAEAKKLANEALPKLRDHLKMTQDLQQKTASK